MCNKSDSNVSVYQCGCESISLYETLSFCYVPGCGLSVTDRDKSDTSQAHARTSGFPSHGETEAPKGGLAAVGGRVTEF